MSQLGEVTCPTVDDAWQKRQARVEALLQPRFQTASYVENEARLLLSALDVCLLDKQPELLAELSQQVVSVVQRATAAVL